MTAPLTANLICGSPARNHDFDFARMKLLDALYPAGGIRTDVSSNYDDAAAIEAGDLLVSYTSQVPVADAQCAALRRHLEAGGRWFAIHASNSVRDNQHLPASWAIASSPTRRTCTTKSRSPNPTIRS